MEPTEEYCKCEDHHRLIKPTERTGGHWFAGVYFPEPMAPYARLCGKDAPNGGACTRDDSHKGSCWRDD